MKACSKMRLRQVWDRRIDADLDTGRLAVESRFDAGLRNLIPPADRGAMPVSRQPKNRTVALLARLRL